jgi:hypothetical protein
MRIGTKSDNEFLGLLNQKNQAIQEKFLQNIENLTKPLSVKVMLGDSTVKDEKTFDPKTIEEFYRKFITELDEWESQKISTSYNDDVRRIFVKFQIKIGCYLLSLHMSLQFHVLLYYKTDNLVLDTQKELAKIIDQTKDYDTNLANNGNKIILDKLRGMGFNDIAPQKLFEKFYNDEALQEKIYQQINDSIDVNSKELTKKKSELLKKLDNMLIETYQTTSILIDDNRLINGEEGCLCNFDLEKITNDHKEGNIDINDLSNDNVEEQILHRLTQVYKILTN